MHTFARLMATTQSYIPLCSMQPHVVVLVISYPKLPRKYLERLRLPRQGWLSYDGLIAMLGDTSWESCCFHYAHEGSGSNPRISLLRALSTHAIPSGPSVTWNTRLYSCSCLKFLRCWCITGDRAFALALAGPVLVFLFVREFDRVFFLGLG